MHLNLIQPENTQFTKYMQNIRFMSSKENALLETKALEYIVQLIAYMYIYSNDEEKLLGYNKTSHA